MAQTLFEHPFYPIIYVRGYAGSQGEVEETVADPYMGFNLGAAKIRQDWKGRVQRYYFESPLVRLMKDYGYRDVYEAGHMMPGGMKVSPASVIIYRYYEQVSEDLGKGERPDIESYATGLAQLINDLKTRICLDDAAAAEAFRVYLVAHSMGGLVCRCFLQHPALPDIGSADVASARRAVDKVFTYATPHNGIDLRVIGNVPGFFSHNNSSNFNRKRMAQYLGLGEDHTENVASLGGKFDISRFFTLVGTNSRDYAVAKGTVSDVVGPMSDGLVRILNATVWDKVGDTVVHSPRAFVNRSHSGHYGIVNSESGYQNLTRFLFGGVRVDGKLEIDWISLPPKVKAEVDKGRKLNASYHFEVVVRTRGGTWDLHRRTVADESAILRTYNQLFHPDRLELDSPRHPHLFSAYLSDREIVKGSHERKHADKRQSRSGSLGFAIDLGVMVPEYEIDHRVWLDDHYEGGYIFRDKINLEVKTDVNDAWVMRYSFDSKAPNRATGSFGAGKDVDGRLEFRIPILQNTRPGIKADLVLTARSWNALPQA